MKRLLPPILGLALILALLAWLPRRVRQDIGPWQPLPNGGEIRVRAVTFGTKHEVDFDDRTAWQRLRDRVANLRKAPGARFVPSGKQKMTTGHSLIIWLEVRNYPRGVPDLSDPALRLPDGEVIYSGSGGGSTVGLGRAHRHISFSVVPYRAARLNVSARIDGKEFTFDLANPAARVRLPAWTPQPLPQTREVGDVALTLRSLRLEPGIRARHLPPWRAKPAWVIRQGGEKADNWYAISTHYYDPGGNESHHGVLLSEPVWRVTAKMYRTEKYPFGHDEIAWLGRIDPAVTGVPLEAMDAARRLNVSYAALLAAGQYEIARDGSVTAVPKTAPRPNWNHAVEPDHQGRKSILRLKSPTVVLLCVKDFPLVLFRAEEDGRVVPGSADRDLNGMQHFLLVPPPARASQLGLAIPKELTFDFYVSAPEKPGLKKATPTP